jgi:hypothetical protein
MKKIYFLFLWMVSASAVFSQTVNSSGATGASSSIVIGGANFHAMEAIYHENEIGNNNFITAGTAIEEISFFIQSQTGLPFSVNNYKVYLKNIPVVTTTFTDGAYSLTGYTLVFSGVVSVDVNNGTVDVPLSAPFVRTAGTNLQILITREDNLVPNNTFFFSSLGILGDNAATACRRYNDVTPLTPGVTSLTASAFRPFIQFRHTFPINASTINVAQTGPISCFNSLQTVDVTIYNEGSTPIAAGAVTTTLEVTASNIGTYQLNNTQTLQPGDIEVISFTNVNLNNPGFSSFKAYVTLAADANAYSDTMVYIGAYTSEVLGQNLSEFPLIEDAETTLPLINFADEVSGTRQLWDLFQGNYTNPDQTSPLIPRAPGNRFYQFDSYSGNNSTGFVSRLYSRCLKVPASVFPNPTPITTVSFWMSHDNIFPGSPDSLYFVVSNDRGNTWTRLAGYQRYDAAALTPEWRQKLVDISAYTGQTIQVGFEGVSKWGNAIGLDDISISYSGPAPITLLSFDARRNGSVNKLSWNTSSEQNSSRFIIERSTDGRNFTELGYVLAAGSSTGQRNYSFNDDAPFKGVNYYQLKMVDQNNSFRYSEIRSIRNQGVSDMQITPNPVVDNLKMQVDALQAGSAILYITDLSGKKIYQQNLNLVSGLNNLNIPMTRLAKGTYFVSLQMTGETLVKKISRL